MRRMRVVWVLFLAIAGMMLTGCTNGRLKAAVMPKRTVFAIADFDRAVFTDVTGDGRDDYCYVITEGSGLVSTSIVVHDIANDQYYEIGERGKYNYDISYAESDRLHVIRVDTLYRCPVEGIVQPEDGKLVFKPKWERPIHEREEL